MEITAAEEEAATAGAVQAQLQAAGAVAFDLDAVQQASKQASQPTGSISTGVTSLTWK